MIKSLYISYNAMTEPIVQSQVIPYLKKLSERNIKFYLLTFEKKRLGKKEKNKIKSVLKEQFILGTNVEWFSCNYHKRPTVPATLFDILIGSIYSIYIVVRYKIDVIHARAIVAALIGYPTAKILSKKFIYDTRGIDSEEYVDAGLWKRGGFKHKIVGFLEHTLIKSSDQVVVLTERFLEILKKRYRHKKIKFSIIPCAVDTDRFKPKECKDVRLTEKLGIRDKFVITYTGSLGTWYMFREMLDFFKVALKLVKNAHFLILTQTDRSYAINAIKQNDLDMKHITVDTTSYDSMPYYLSVCDMGIFFIKPVFSKLSSSPVKFAEYLSNGLPVVINSGIGDTGSLVKYHSLGSVVDDFNEESYAKAIKAVTGMLKTERGALKARCRRVAEKELSLNMATEKYGKIYERIIT